MTWLAETALPRVALAHRRSDELLADISKWRTSKPLRTSLIVKDAPECGWYVQVDAVDPSPRLDRWGLQVGEVAHHLRSILNTTLTRIVQAEDGTPSKALQYPIALTPKAWRQQSGRIKGLPERVQRAIYASQPFLWARNAGRLAEDNVLSVLGWVDNEDKHRLELQGHFGPSWIQHKGRIVTPDGDSRLVTPKLTFDWSLVSGSRMIDADTTPHVVQEIENVTLDLQIEVLFPDELGTTTIVPQLLEEIWNAYQDAFLTVVMAWADEQIDYELMAGSSDFLRGVAFGKAAVDTTAGEGTWDHDYARRRGLRK